MKKLKYKSIQCMLIIDKYISNSCKQPYIIRIGALSAPLFAPQKNGSKYLVWVYILHQLLAHSCGGQMRE